MERQLAPATPAITAGMIQAALTRAAWIMHHEEGADPVSRSLARALLYLYEKLQGDTVIVEGDTLKMSVALLRDLYDMPDHESAVVRFIRGSQEHDGTRVLMLQPVDQPYICARQPAQPAEGGA